MCRSVRRVSHRDLAPGRIKVCLPICLVLVATAASAFIPPAKTVRAVTQETPWITFVPADEEFVVSIPAQPTVRIYPVSRPRDSNVERVRSHVAYSGYGDGLIFILDSFSAEHPQKLPQDLLGLRNPSSETERDLTIDGLSTKMYRRTISNSRGSYTQAILRFVTQKHVYNLTLITLEETNSAVERLLASLQWHRLNAQVTPIPAPPETSPGPVFSASQVTRRAVVVWKSEPWYTEEARRQRTKGRVILNVVFAENGYVTDIQVTQGLPNGLSEAAIDAARNIRFFPAIYNGKPVGQRSILEYNFDVY